MSINDVGVLPPKMGIEPELNGDSEPGRCVESREKNIVYIYMGLYRFMQLNHGSYGGNQQ